MMAAVDATTFGKVIDPVISNIIDPIVMFLFAVALVVFTYGVLKYVWGSSEGDDRTHAKNSMLGGIIGMFIMLSAWGIVYLISNTIKTF
jgi:uncharacterized protein YqgC (DUF456 family)